MNRVVPIGTESYNVTVALRSSTTGQLVTDKVYGGVTYSYWRDGAGSGATGTAITASKGTWASAGFVETDYDGLYQFGIPNACLLTGATGCKLKLVVADCIDTLIDIQLTSVTRGLSGTALPDAVAGAADGLVIGSAAYKLAVDSAGKVAVPDTQKVDVDTIKTVAVAATATVTFANGTVSTLTQTQVSGGAYDLTNSTYITALKSGLGTIPASIATNQIADIQATRAAYLDKCQYLPAVTAGNAGGVMIAGANAATTFASLTVTAAMTNGSTVLGNTTIGTLGVGAVTQTGACSLGATSTVTLNTLAVTGALSVGTTTTLTGVVTASAANSITGIDVTKVGGTTQTAGDIIGRIGTPANIDTGGATLADNLKKLADDNGGATFDATSHSLAKISTAVVTGVASTLQATNNVQTTGTLVSGTFASTYLSNGTSWVLAPVTPAVAEAGSALSPFGLNANLLFTAGAGQTINSVSIRGNFAAGSGRYTNVYAYNYNAPGGWDMLSDVGTRMNTTSTLTSYTYPLLAAHQKPDAGGDGQGAVRIGFKSPSITTSDRLNVDLCLVNVATANPSTSDIADAVYAKMATSVYGRQVWIDTVNGVDGSLIGVNGLDHTPVKTIAYAYQLCDDLGLKTIAFKSGSNATGVTLTRSAAGWRFYGPGKIDLNGQSIANAIFEECYSVYGTSADADANFYRCQMGSSGITLDHSYLTDCRIKGAITLIANVDPIIFQNCIDATGAGADFELIFVANATAIIRNFQGGITLKSMVATNSVIIDGAMRVTINASCTAGSITVRGFAPVLDGATAFTTAPNTGTITQTQRYGTDQDTSGTTELLTRTPDATAGETGGLAIVGSKMKLTETWS